MSDEVNVKLSVDNLIALRRSMVDLYVNEANGIWQRFNFFVAVEIALFAGALTSLGGGLWHSLLTGFIGLLGLWFSFTAIASLERLWLWHGTYFDQAVKLEKRVHTLADQHSIAELCPMPLQEIRELNLVNSQAKSFSPEASKLTVLLNTVLKFGIKLIYGRELQESAFSYLQSRPTHRFLSVFVVAWLMLICIALVKFSSILLPNLF